jgi:hypothetical protein
METPTANELQSVVDHRDIENIITLYCRAIDRLDIELLKSVYHEDARDEHANFSGTALEFAE